MRGTGPRNFDATEDIVEERTLLEASAGTGKTYTIGGLFVRLVAEQGLGVESILVVTFTDAATADLRQRIRNRVRDALAVVRGEEGAGDDLVFGHLVALGVADPAATARHVAHLSVALESFDRAAISTIHGFCRRVLGENAFESGAEFDVELVGEPRDLVADVIQDHWTSELHAADLGLVVAMRSRHLNLKGSLALGGFVSEHPHVRLVPEPQDPDPGPRARWLDARQEVREAWTDHGDAARSYLVSFIGNRVINGGAFKFKTEAELSETWAQLSAFVHGEMPPESGLIEELRLLDIAWLSDKRNDAEPPIWFGVPGGVPGQSLFDAVTQWRLLDEALKLELNAEALRQRHRLADRIRTEVPRRKRELHQQSFSDLLHTLRERVMLPEAGEALCDAIRERFSAVLIDEFQDTDPVQWDIFRSVFDQTEAVFTLIGDPKQAIYSFRGADIHTYIGAAESTPVERRRTLGVNYRADRGLVRATNHLFGQGGALEEPLGDPRIQFHPVTAHHEDDRLDMAADLEFSPLQIRVLSRKEHAVEERKVCEEPVMRSAVLASMAGEMGALLTSGSRIRRDPESPWRPIDAGDLAVLVRTNDQARAVQSVLREHGIPGVLQGTSSVFESADAEEWIQVLTAIANPRSRRAVHSALATPLMGLDAPTLATLHESAAWEEWLVRFRDWGRRWEEDGFLAMSRRFLQDATVHRRLLRLRDGERRVTNLHHLMELCHAESVASMSGPEGLLSWLRAQLGTPSNHDDARELRLESDSEAVTIITVHRSKGLEYSFVWCPFLWNPKKKTPPSWGIEHHDVSAGDAPVVHVGARDTEAGEAAVAQWKHEKWTENLRLLYVAITRARHGCVLYWGGAFNCVQSPLCWVLHQSGAASDGRSLAAVEKRFKKLTDAEIRADLEGIASGSGETIAVRGFHPGFSGVVPSRDSGDTPLQARVYSRAEPLDGDWRRASYSAMIRGSWKAGEGAPRDHDAHVDDDSGVPAERPTHARVPLHDFPRGARAGTFLHHVLEHLDFQDMEGLEELVRTSLTRHGFEADKWTEKVVLGIESALKTDLQDADGAPHTLADIPSSHRYNELDFDLPVAGGPAIVDAAAIARVFAEHARTEVPVEYAARLEALRFVPLRGFLTGSIDLVYWHEGRFYVADHKSNFLGTHAADYPHEAMSEAMQHHHYLLQSHLYTVALHRYLQWRLGPDVYDYDTHMGGVRYLFVRGMVGPGEHGVFRDRPPAAMIHALDRVIAGQGDGR